MNATLNRHVDRPVKRSAGVSMRRERRWGLFGGLVGAVFGLASALIAVYIEGASWWSPSATLPAVLCTPPVADLRLFPSERADRRGLVSNRRLVDGTDRTLSTHGYLRRDFGGHDSHVAGRRASIHAPGCDRARWMTDRSRWRCGSGD